MIFGGKLYQRYIVREALAAILLVLLAFLVLFSFFNLLDELNSVGKGAYRLSHAAFFVLLKIPGLIYELIPIAALIGALYALSNLARHSEITVLRASGLATSNLLAALFRVAGLLALVAFLVGEVMVPTTERLAQDIRTRALSEIIAKRNFDSGLWVKDGKSFINIAQSLPDQPLRQLRVYLFDDDLALRSVTEAASAEYAGDQRWLLKDVVRTVLEGEVSKVEQVGELVWQSAITPDLLSVLSVSPESMSLFELLGYTKHLADNRQSTTRYEIAIWKKIVYPLTALVMVALALPFGYSHNRVGGVSLKIFSGVMIGIFFYMLNGLFSNLGVINAWPPLASVSAPSILFILAAVLMLWWAERR